MEITSTSFKENEMIPKLYTCDGKDISPPLEWKNIPEGTESFALICDDPDAPHGTWVHWVYYDIPSTVKVLPEGVATIKKPDIGGNQGINDFRRIGYGGPCPPGGTHRYHFKLYALNRVLNLEPGLTKEKLINSMKFHVIEKTRLTGKYKR